MSKEEKVDIVAHLSTMELKRQEAIFELTTTEEQYLTDLTNLRRVYASTMRKLGAITIEEERMIFCNLAVLEEIHSGQSVKSCQGTCK